MSATLTSPTIDVACRCQSLRSLKKVQGKKKRDAEVAEAVRKALGPTESVPELPDLAGGGGDLLGSKDEDVIF